MTITKTTLTTKNLADHLLTNDVYSQIQVYIRLFFVVCRQRPYHVESTGSRPITEVKQRRARLVLGWVTAWEHRVLLATFFFSPSDFFFFFFLCDLTFFFTVCVLTFRFLNPSSPPSSSSPSFFLIMLIFQLSSFSFCKCTLFFFLMLVTFFLSWPVFSCPPPPPPLLFSSSVSRFGSVLLFCFSH